MISADFLHDAGRLRHPRPGGVDPAKEISSFDRLAFEKLEILCARAALDIDPEALALVHRAAGGGDFRIRLPEQRLISARFDGDQARGIEGNVARAEEKL